MQNLSQSQGAWSMGHRVRGQKADDRGQHQLLNIEQQNKEPQNDEVITSICLRRILRFKEGSSSDEVNLDCSLLNSGSRLLAFESAIHNPKSAIIELYALCQLDSDSCFLAFKSAIRNPQFAIHSRSMLISSCHLMKSC